MISTLRDGDEVDGVFACVRKDRLTTRTGIAYLALELRDRTGTIAARAFRDADVLAGRFERGELVRVSGRVQRFRDELTIDVEDVARVEPGGEGADPDDFLPSAYRDVDELDGFLEHFAREVYDPGYRALLERCSPTRSCVRSCAARRAPAAGITPTSAGCSSTRSRWRRSHASSATCTGASNSDLLLTAAIVHDVGRIREFTLRRRDRPDRGGAAARPPGARQQMLIELAGEVALDQDRRLALLHCVLCHHGAGAAPGGRFASAEALALYRVNALDASVKGALEHGLP